MDAMRMRRRGAEYNCLTFQHIQHRAIYGNRSARFRRQGIDSGKVSNRNDLPCGMRMVFT